MNNKLIISEGARKEILENCFKHYRQDYIATDPVMFIHAYTDDRDKETAGLIAALMALGNVKQIQRSVCRIMKLLEPSPYKALKRFNGISEQVICENIYHRFFDAGTIAAFLFSLHRVLEKKGRLKNVFVPLIKAKGNIKEALIEIAEEFYQHAYFHYQNRRKLRTLFSTPLTGSACKRWLLFLRWMIRPSDGVDLGLWNEISPSWLLIPVDTHIYCISRKLGFTRRNTISWKMAEEITENLKQYDPEDPVKYDFALTRIAMLKDTRFTDLFS
ncbi:MAG: TIGR02757 family protein [Candidatus Fischerbacteria bacterium RBG_13_37_8]|uniref:TIGR02757 family protein n=1 Tax=Candidatus Fischerbacteria bacterium RBG_13_37_8 TaxID=1817863 RepID=A0A1F5VMB2_9BACT|nr:MAG: TIGR02757 family protein [Candidatus Fischerbacteria bacterium RBG_13_37_8]